MFAQILIAEANAATTGASSTVDMQTLIMTIVSGIVLGLGTLLYKKAPNGEKPQVAPPVNVDAVLGPYQAIFDRLGTIQLTLERIAGGHVETREATANALQMTRHDLKAILHEMGQAAEADMEEIKCLMRVQNAVSDRLDEFLRAKIK